MKNLETKNLLPQDVTSEGYRLGKYVDFKILSLHLFCINNPATGIYFLLRFDTIPLSNRPMPQHQRAFLHITKFNSNETVAPKSKNGRIALIIIDSILQGTT